MFNPEYQCYMQEASGLYYAELLPEGWHKWEGKEAVKWCEDNVWEPFENMPTNWVWGQCDMLARNIYRLVTMATQPLEDALAESEQEIDNLRRRINKDESS